MKFFTIETKMCYKIESRSSKWLEIKIHRQNCIFYKKIGDLRVMFISLTYFIIKKKKVWNK